MPKQDEDFSSQPVPSTVAEAMDKTAEENGGAFTLPPDYEGAFGRTMFDAANSRDGSVTAVMPAENIEGSSTYQVDLNISPSGAAIK
ncbi:MAG: hypothetical protein AB1744_12100 [Candidatus Zixiibacteriota bacterium]